MAKEILFNHLLTTLPVYNSQYWFCIMWKSFYSFLFFKFCFYLKFQSSTITDSWIYIMLLSTKWLKLAVGAVQICLPNIFSCKTNSFSLWKSYITGASCLRYVSMWLTGLFKHTHDLSLLIRGTKATDYCCQCIFYIMYLYFESLWTHLWCKNCGRDLLSIQEAFKTYWTQVACRSEVSLF